MIGERNINISKKWLIIIKILLMISCPFFTLLVSNRFNIYHTIIGCVCSFIFAIITFRNFKIDSINSKVLFVYTLISCYFIVNNLPFADCNVLVMRKIFKGVTVINNLSSEVIIRSIGLMALPVTIFFVKYFCENVFNKVCNFFRNLTGIEKRFLYIVLIVSFIVSFVVINHTVAFSRPVFDYDVIYTSDTGALLKYDAYMNISYLENDIRQPLFGLFSIPFSLTAKVISSFCFFFRNQYEYETVMTIFQFILLAISTILLSRLLNVSEDKKKYFYIFISFSFPYVLFSILLEQYVICLFYLILAIYYYFENPNKINYLYIGAVGTLITSGIIFPLIVKFKSIKQWLKSIFKCFVVFVGTVTISGQLPQVFTLIDKLDSLLGTFADKVTFTDKFNQYTAFVKGLFFSNRGHIVWESKMSSYQLMPCKSIEWIGILILLICFISFILNRKNKMALISILWIVFSSVILLFVGWGTAENGLILYSLYFAWAFYSLIYLLIDKLFKDNKYFKLVILLLVLIFFIVNIGEVVNILGFAIKYHT